MRVKRNKAIKLIANYCVAYSSMYTHLHVRTKPSGTTYFYCSYQYGEPCSIKIFSSFGSKTIENVDLTNVENCINEMVPPSVTYFDFDEDDYKSASNQDFVNGRMRGYIAKYNKKIDTWAGLFEGSTFTYSYKPLTTRDLLSWDYIFVPYTVTSNG